MKLSSEAIPKFIISLEKDKERAKYLKNEVYPKLTNYFKCRAFDGEEDDANKFLKENNIFVSDIFMDKCNVGQLGCFLSHFSLWKYIVNNKLEIAIILEDDVKIYKNFNRIIDTVYENLPIKFDYVHLFIHPDKQNVAYLEGKEGDIIPAEDNFGTVAYIISLRGAKRLIKLTELLKIQAPVDRQINFCIQHNFLKAYMIKKPFLITQGEILPNRSVYENSFKSNIWYSKKLSEINKINKEFIKLAGFSDDEINLLDTEISKNKNRIQNKKNLPSNNIPENPENAEQKTSSDESDKESTSKNVDDVIVLNTIENSNTSETPVTAAAETETAVVTETAPTTETPVTTTAVVTETAPTTETPVTTTAVVTETTPISETAAAETADNTETPVAAETETAIVTESAVATAVVMEKEENGNLISEEDQIVNTIIERLQESKKQEIVEEIL